MENPRGGRLVLTVSERAELTALVDE